MKHYIGLDVAMKRTFICILDESGKIVHEGSENTDPNLLADYLQKMGLEVALVGFESGSLSHYLLNGFKERALPAMCIDARKMSAILSLKINKTDKNDARGIAEALRSGMFTRVHHKDQESVNRGVILVARRTMVNQRTQLKNCVRGLLKSYGVRLGSVGASRFNKTVKSHLQGLDATVQLSFEGLLNSFDHLTHEIEKLDKKLLETASQDKDVKLLLTIPGIGVITAITYKTEIFDPHRFSDSRSVGAYLGMTPKQYSSGDTQTQGRVSKCGSNELRSLLVEAGLVIITRTKKWSKLKAWGLKLMRKKGAKKAALAVGRKLAVIMHRMLIEQKEFIYGEQKAA
ncbi:MAG: IS110 family transposase [Rhabdochlamydiaceae bacterium]